MLARGAGEGRRAGVLPALGVSTGVLVHTAATAFGLAALFEVLPRSRAVVAALGACYLAFPGVRSLRAARTDGHEPAGALSSRG